MRRRFPRKFHCSCGLGQRIGKEPRQLRLTGATVRGPGIEPCCTVASGGAARAKHTHRDHVHLQVSSLKYKVSRKTVCAWLLREVPRLISAQHKCLGKACPDLCMQFPPLEGAVSHSTRGLLIALQHLPSAPLQPHIDWLE